MRLKIHPDRLREVEFTPGNYHRCGLYVVEEGDEARKVHGGDMIPGPWAGMIGLATVIHDGPYEPPPVLVAIEVGDQIEIIGQCTVEIVAIDRGEYPKLEVV